jgi:tRNA A-37 threonylcarbamoyl transferase component Bud32
MVGHSDEPFAGRYTIERELGRGGMATVYRARDLRHHRAVALKVLHPEFAASVGGDRFSREIRVLASLHHPHILPLFDSGEHEGAVFYVVPCVEGESLRHRLERERQLPLEEALRITREVADALDYAHRHDVIHRDVKPENILLEEGHAIVADFGVARALTRAIGESSTTAGMVVGTPAYMSPEQASGDEDLDGRSDQYSLACVLYEMLAGAPPFSGTTPRATMARRFTEPPPSLRGERDVPEPFDRALRRALSAVPADRFVDVAAFAKALDAAVAPARPPTRTVATLGIPAAAVIALALVIWWPRGGGADTLDPGLHVVIPFAVDGKVPATGMDGAAIARRLSRAMGFWRDVRIVDPLRTSDAVERKGAPRTLRDALGIARMLGAGRLLWGDAWGHGDSVEVRAALYDVARGREVRGATVTMGTEVNTAGPVFDALSDSLALGAPRSHAAAPGARGTRVREAFVHYEAGHYALATWDILTAEREFRRASDLDPEFAQAALWSAQSMAWRGADPGEWHAAAASAWGNRAALDRREELQAAGLLALAEYRFPDACDQYRTMLSRDSLDFAAWHGLASCQARDPLVERDPRSPTGWRFRGSLHAGLAAYLRAMNILPSFHRAATQLSPLPTDFFPVEEGSIRGGYALTPDTVRFGAVSGLEADTLSYVPYPMADVVRAAGGSWPATHTAAVGWARERLRRVAEAWVRAFPASSEAHAIHSAALEVTGDLARAASEIHQARTLATDSTVRVRLTHDEVRVHVKSGEFARAVSLADSSLAAQPEPTTEQAHWLAGLAALTGHVHRTRVLLESDAEDSTFVFWYNGERVTAPRLVTRAALALQAYAAFPAPRDSTLALARRVRQLVTVWVPPVRRDLVRAAAMSIPITFGMWMVEPSSVLSITGSGPLHRAQRALALGDTATVRAAAASVRAAPAEERQGDIDHLYQEAMVFLAVRDTAAATLLLNDALNGLATGPRWLLEDPHRAASIASAMRMRALVASRAGDTLTARKWARAALTLWRGADEELRPFLEPLRPLAGEPNM